VAIDGYASTTSVRQGEEISFHISDDASDVIRIEIVNSVIDSILLTLHYSRTHYATPDNASELGCGWPPLCSIAVPSDWPSGLYYARISNSESPPG
jgi:hypothetical protein